MANKASSAKRRNFKQATSTPPPSKEPQRPKEVDFDVLSHVSRQASLAAMLYYNTRLFWVTFPVDYEGKGVPKPDRLKGIAGYDQYEDPREQEAYHCCNFAMKALGDVVWTRGRLVSPIMWEPACWDCKWWLHCMVAPYSAHVLLHELTSDFFSALPDRALAELVSYWRLEHARPQGMGLLTLALVRSSYSGEMDRVNVTKRNDVLLPPPWECHLLRENPFGVFHSLTETFLAFRTFHGATKTFWQVQREEDEAFRELEREIAGEGTALPAWDGHKTITYRGRRAHFKRHAPNQFAILSRFQGEGWAEVVGNPLYKDIDCVEKTRQALAPLNKTLRTVGMVICSQDKAIDLEWAPIQKTR